MDQIISLIIWIVLFCIAAFGMIWVCDKFGLPAPVKWICGALLLIVILLFVSRQLGYPGTWPALR